VSVGRLDQYSVGTMLFEAYAGRLPWAGPGRKARKNRVKEENYFIPIYEIKEIDRCGFCWNGTNFSEDAKDLITKVSLSLRWCIT
jgi:hypothetical protein